MSIKGLHDDVFEIEMSKRKIKLDTPIVIGSSILQITICVNISMIHVRMDTVSSYFATCGEFETLIFQHTCMYEQFLWSMGA